MTQDKSYLGDGVYYQANETHIILTVEDGITALHTVYLEAEVIERFLTLLAQRFDKEALCKIIQKA